MIKKKNSNQEDKKIWEDYIKNPSDIYDKDQNISNNFQRRERYKFDLHGFTLDEANKKVKINYFQDHSVSQCFPCFYFFYF